MKVNYEVTEEWWAGQKDNIRTARVEKRDKSGHCYDVGRISLPDDMFTQVRELIETFEYEEEK